MIPQPVEVSPKRGTTSAGYTFGILGDEIVDGDFVVRYQGEDGVFLKDYYGNDFVADKIYIFSGEHPTLTKGPEYARIIFDAQGIPRDVDGDSAGGLPLGNATSIGGLPFFADAQPGQQITVGLTADGSRFFTTTDVPVATLESAIQAGDVAESTPDFQGGIKAALPAVTGVKPALFWDPVTREISQGEVDLTAVLGGVETLISNPLNGELLGITVLPNGKLILSNVPAPDAATPNLAKVLSVGFTSESPIQLINNYYARQTENREQKGFVGEKPDGSLGWFGGLFPDGRPGLGDEAGQRVAWDQNIFAIYTPNLQTSGVFLAPKLRTTTKILAANLPDNLCTQVLLPGGGYEIQTTGIAQLEEALTAYRQTIGGTVIDPNDAWVAVEACDLAVVADASKPYIVKITTQMVGAEQPHNLGTAGANIFPTLLDANNQPDTIMLLTFPTTSTYRIDYPEGLTSGYAGGKLKLELI